MPDLSQTRKKPFLQMNKIPRYLLIIFIITALVIILGCGNNIPELKQINSQINFSKLPDSDTVVTELVVLVNAEDEDGDDDIESLHVINEDGQLFWSVNRSNWSSRSSRGMKWLGYEKFLTADGSLAEAGEYRILVIDRAGERVENNIFIPLFKDIPKPDDFSQLLFTDDDNFIELKSTESRNIIAFYNSEGKLLGAFSATPGVIEIKKLKDGASILENYRSIEVSYYSNSYGAGILSGPFFKD